MEEVITVSSNTSQGFAALSDCNKGLIIGRMNALIDYAPLFNCLYAALEPADRDFIDCQIRQLVKEQNTPLTPKQKEEIAERKLAEIYESLHPADNL